MVTDQMSSRYWADLVYRWRGHEWVSLQETSPSLRRRVEAKAGPRPSNYHVLCARVVNGRLDDSTFKWALSSDVPPSARGMRKTYYVEVESPDVASIPAVSEAPTAPPVENEVRDYWAGVHRSLRDWLPEGWNAATLRREIEGRIGPRARTDVLLRIVVLDRCEIDVDSATWILAAQANAGRVGRNCVYACPVHKGLGEPSVPPPAPQEQPKSDPVPVVRVPKVPSLNFVPHTKFLAVEAPATHPHTELHPVGKSLILGWEDYLYPEAVRAEQLVEELPLLVATKLKPALEEIALIEREIAGDLVQQKAKAVAPSVVLQPSAERLAARKAAYAGALALFGDILGMHGRWDGAAPLSPLPAIVKPSTPCAPLPACEEECTTEENSETTFEESVEESIEDDAPNEDRVTPQNNQTTLKLTAEAELTDLAREFPLLVQELKNGKRILVVGGHDVGGYASARRAFAKKLGVPEHAIEPWFMQNSGRRSFQKENKGYVGIMIMDRWVSHMMSEAAMALARESNPRIPYVYIGKVGAGSFRYGAAHIERSLRESAPKYLST